MSLKQFCTDAGLVDLSPLVEADLPVAKRCAVVWGVMQEKLSVEQQREFLRQFCDSADSPVLKMMAGLFRGDFDKQQCSTAFNMILLNDGMDAVLSMRMKECCVQHGIRYVSSMLDKFGLESVVFLLEDIFPFIKHNEHLQAALDELKFEANPEKFSGELDRMIQSDLELFTSKVSLCDAEIGRLEEEKAALLRELEEEEGATSPILFGPGPSGVPGPGGFIYRKRRGGLTRRG